MFRVCLGCKKELPATREYYHYTNKTKDNCASRCKVCLGSKSYGVKEPNKVFRTKEGHKICTQCRKELPHCDFFVCNDNKDGYYSKCKECYSEYKKEIRKRPEQKEKTRSYNTEYRKRYYATEHGKRINAINCQRRKHRKNQAIDNYDIRIWEETLEYFNHKCSYCDSSEELYQEHVIPLSKGGSYTKQNIIPACLFCNSSKHNNDLEKWYPNQTFFNQKRLEKIYKWIGYNIKNKTQQLSIL
ncbi:TPA: HNH endonuclease signature motif containing protein [Bacillus paranthracis]